MSRLSEGLALLVNMGMNSVINTKKSLCKKIVTFKIYAKLHIRTLRFFSGPVKSEIVNGST